MYLFKRNLKVLKQITNNQKNVPNNLLQTHKSAITFSISKHATVLKNEYIIY